MRPLGGQRPTDPPRTLIERGDLGVQERQAGRAAGQTGVLWLRRVVKNMGIHYLRGLREFTRTAERPGEDRRYWHLLEAADEEAAASSAAGTDPRDRVLAAQLLDYLDRTIPARGAGYHSDHAPAACSQMLADGAAVNALDSAVMCAGFA